MNPADSSGDDPPAACRDPEDLHRQLKARAARQGRSLSDYVLDELRVAADRPTMGEWLAAVETLPAPAHQPAAAADVLADERRR